MTEIEDFKNSNQLWQQQLQIDSSNIIKRICWQQKTYIPFQYNSTISSLEQMSKHKNNMQTLVVGIQLLMEYGDYKKQF